MGDSMHWLLSSSSNTPTKHGQSPGTQLPKAEDNGTNLESIDPLRVLIQLGNV
jgi:hypothetical protein